MGDRCYMSLVCRRQDKERFEELGFVLNCRDEGPLLEMEDAEANYAHCGDLPKDIPYHGSHGAGGDYGPGVFACDGTTYAEVEGGHNGGLVIHWDETTNRPLKSSLQAIREYRSVEQAVRAQFEKLAACKK